MGWYRESGADRPFGNLLAAHGVAMEGYFWRFTLLDGRALIALAGVNRAGPLPRDRSSASAIFGPSEQHWATLGLAAYPGGTLFQAEHPTGAADPHGLGVVAGDAFRGWADELHVHLSPDARLDATILAPRPWPRGRFGGSSIFQTVPGLNQYWHPWLLGGTARGTAVVGGEVWNLDGASVYAEKNWGRGGFPESWWWGQAQAFDDGTDACVAFAGGQVHAGPLRTEVTGLVVLLPDGTLLRLGNPGTSPVRARVTDEEWLLHGRSGRWEVEVRADAPLDDAHVLPVPLPAERRNVPGAIEHLGGRMRVRVRRGGRTVWQATSNTAGLEHGGLDRAAAELARRDGAVAKQPPSTEAARS